MTCPHHEDLVKRVDDLEQDNKLFREVRGELRILLFGLLPVYGALITMGVWLLQTNLGGK